MKTKTFPLGADHNVVITEISGKGHTARLVHKGRVCPIAAGVGDTAVAALYDLKVQKHARTQESDIEELVRQLPAN